MSSRNIDDIASAIVDRLPIDWSAAGGRAGRQDPVVAQLWALSWIRGAHGGDRIAGDLRRRLPVTAAVLQWACIARVALGTAGTLIATWRLRVPRVPFVLVVLLAFAGTAAMLGVSGRDGRARLLGVVYWTIAAAFAASGVTYLTRMPGLAWLSPVDAVRPEALLGAAVWLFVREFPRTHVMSRLDSLCTWAFFVSAVSGMGLVVALALGRIPLPVFQSTTLILALPAIVVLLLRWRGAIGVEGARVRLFLLALLVAVTPVTLSAMIDALWPDLGTFFRSPGGLWVGSWFAYPPLLALLLLTAYAVSATNVLPVRAMLHAGARSVVAQQVPIWATAAASTLSGLRLFLGRDQTLAQSLADPVTRALLAIAGAAAVLYAARPLLLPMLDRWARPRKQSHSIVLARLTAMLRSARTPLEVARVFAEAVETALQAPAEAYLTRFGRLVPVGRNGLAPPVETFIPVLLETGEPSVIGEGLGHSLFDLMGAADQDWTTRAAAAALAPIATQRGTQELLGMIAIERPRDGFSLSADDLEFLRTCTAAAALACESLQVRQDESALDGVGLQCSKCGLVEAWSSGEGACPCGGARQPAILPKRLAGRLEIVQWLGSGGMGAVYRAIDVTLRRDVAVKALTWLSHESAQRALDEARTMASLSHANVAVLYGSESWQGTPVLVMEHLSGGTLAARITRGPVSYRAAVEWAAQLASALDYVHGAGKYHGDVKPSNVGFTAEGVPELLDFGLSRAVHTLDDDHDGRPGPIGGTPAYLSPDVWQGARPGPSLDIWALSVVFCEMLVGRHPYGALRDEAAIAERVSLLVTDLRGSVPRHLCDLLENALCGGGGTPRTAASFRSELLREPR